MAWVQLDDNFPNHPKAMAAGPVASYLFVCGLCYCRRFHTNGFIPSQAIPSLGVTRKPTRMIEGLLSVGLWIPTDGGYRVNGYDERYSDVVDKAVKDATAKHRREAGRKGGLSRIVSAKQNTDFASSTVGIGTVVGTSDVLLKEKKRDEDFETFWAAYPRHDGKQQARAEWVRIDPDEDIQRVMGVDLERRSRSAGWLKDSGQFIPHARTYLHQRRWEDGFEERPRLAERTVNVMKGFEDPTGTDG